MESLELLKRAIDNTVVIENEAWEEMQHCWGETSLGRKQVVTSVGEVAKYMYFIIEGIQRAYIERDGKESTLVFSYEGSFSGIIDSFLLQQPSLYYLETITKSRMLRIHYRDFTTLMEKYSSVERWARVAITHALSGTLERNIELLSYNAEEKFRVLLQRSPHVLNMIPHKYLASYIGVDPTTFSKMLSKVRL